MIAALFTLAVLTTSGSTHGTVADVTLLLEGVLSIASPGTPGEVCAFGPEAFVLVAGNGDAPVAAGGRCGKGRALIFGHGGFLGVGALGTGDTGRLVKNALKWMTRGRFRARVAHPDHPGLKDWLEGAGLRSHDGNKLDAAVIFLDAQRVRSEEELASLRQFLNDGGGVIAAATGWGWLQLNPGKTLAEDLPGNRLLVPFGLAFGAGTVGGTGGSGFLSPPSPPPLAHAGHAYQALLAGELDRDGARIAEGRLFAAMGCLPESETLLVAPLVQRVRLEAEGWKTMADINASTMDRLAVRVLDREWRRIPAAEVPASPVVREFPGRVPTTARVLSAVVTITPSHRGWHGTGLYAVAGKTVSMEITKGAAPAGTRIRIGCHKDSLWNKSKWQRWPAISIARTLQEGKLELTSPHGGLIYVEPGRVNQGEVGEGKPFRLRFEQVVTAPRFVLGVDDPSEWAKTLAENLAPWGEIEGKHVIHSLPRETLARVQNPATVATYWDAVWDAHSELGAGPIASRPERIVADIQIGGGYMHSGYPIMTHLDGGEIAVDMERLVKQGSWGHFHELGHNSQRGDWTFGGTGEVTCNLFSLHAMEQVVGITPWDHPWMAGARRNAPAFIEKGAPFDEWKRNPGIALVSYAELQKAFGWEPFKAVFAEYRGLPGPERPKNDQQKRDQWCVRFSRQVQRDLSPFFARWGIPIGGEVASALADLPAWDGTGE